jgi:hypothetical protein
VVLSGGLLLATTPFGHTLEWFLVAAGIGLSPTGFIRSAQDGATNRDTAAAWRWAGSGSSC